MFVDKFNVTPLLERLEQNFIAQYLYAYGIEDFATFINPTYECRDNPFQYAHMEEAIDLLHNSINSNISIIMDSDTDGACSASLIYLLLKRLGNVPNIICHHIKQHGIDDVLESIVVNNTHLLIVPDAGSNDVDSCKILKENGINTIILDHHNIEVDNPYAIVINNHANDSTNQHLSGTGVAYKFAEAYTTKYQCDIGGFETLVAISIISDVCDVRSIENRYYLHEGLNSKNLYSTEWLKSNVLNSKVLSTEDVGWRISPLCNTLARTEDDTIKYLFFDWLVGECDMQETFMLLERIHSAEREKIEKYVSTIYPNIDKTKKCIVNIVDKDYQHCTGLIATKISSKYSRPTIILTDQNDFYSGSVRSPIDILPIINSSELATCKGHNRSCGIRIEKDKYNDFLSFLETIDVTIDNSIKVTANCTSNEITIELCRQCSNTQLWGEGLPKPIFHVVLDNPKIDIYEKKTTTVKLTENNVPFLIWRVSASDKELLKIAKKIEVLCELSVNEFRGKESPQAIVSKWNVIE